MTKKFAFLLVIIVVAVVATSAGAVSPAFADDPEPGKPDVWTERVCSGDAAVVWQSEDEQGDGVTLSVLNEEGCETNPDLGWFVIEPWAGAKLNPDRACLAYSWDEVQEFVEVSGLDNGSAWRVESADLEGHALVLPCLTADSEDFQLGLNPYESQLETRKLRGTLRLLDELLGEAGLTREEYMAKDEPLAESLRAVFEAD